MPKFLRGMLQQLRDVLPPRSRPTLEDAGRLFGLGMEFNEQGEFKKALKIARHLKACKYTGAWEIEAVALYGSGDLDGAIRILEAGLEAKPVWRTGHLLGIYLSDAGRYADALAAFDASLGMYMPDRLCTTYNQAIVHDRMGDSKRAIQMLEQALADTSRGGEDDPETVKLATEFLERLMAEDQTR